MSKYGTIPTTSSTPAPEGSSQLDFISRAKARGASALATRRPWRELADPRALSVPRGFSDAYRRARANLAHFAANYALVVLLVVFVSLLWRPVSMLVFLACFAAWLVLYFLRDRDVDGTLVICGRGVGDGVVVAVTLVLLLLTGATGFILTSLLVGLLLVLLHALLHRPADSIDDEAGRWYTPVPPSNY
ncbi:prenylated rab acceptor family protein [Zea mays]|jgi:PRA1 family protein 1|uniref:PRA1 family protein n=1 Tax=Zea mays TaxID=4577 RepID=A0A1D6M083_MAIZE|nr:prenylated rab acceptor family protein [Zea mays]AQK84722.1 Prenylated rab acceptor family protein [Zea mays]|eukprot:NP_001150209.2 prenylated rab acceptor family protein [Zea mays]